MSTDDRSLKHLRRIAYLFLFVLACASMAMAQLPAPGSASGFDITGFLQEAILDSSCTANAHCGGTLKVNGHVVTVPKETIVVLPANQLTWQELFAQAPAPWGIPGTPTPGGGVASMLLNGVMVAAPTTGMAMADCATSANPCSAPPLTTYEVEVVGNVIPQGTGPNGTPGQAEYVAGLIYMSQQTLNSGQGYVTNINYTTGEMQVLNTLDASIVRIQMNDPAGVPVPNKPGTFTGRYSIGNTPDKRFTVDQDNPTIRSVTGFPMCLPRIAPPALPTVGDGLCPEFNRPKDNTGAYAGSFFMSNPAQIPAQNSTVTDPRIQAPFEIGDYITFSGTLVKDCSIAGVCAASNDGPTVGPWPASGSSATYISAHTIVNNIAIYTAPNTNPAYVATDVTILGTGGTTVLGVTEATARTRFEGFATDPTRQIHLYAMDLNPATGALAGNRDWGTIDIDPGPPTGAVMGRWRFRPPSKVLSMPSAGNFLPATREVRAVLEPTATSPLAGWTCTNIATATGCQATTAANGLIYGQYHAPINEFLFPEQLPGNPVPPMNFETIPFLAQGGYTSTAGTLAGILNPWPGSIAPCGGAASASAVVRPGSSVFGGTTVTLDATGSTGGNLTYSWTQNPADLTQVALTGAQTATASFTAPATAGTLNFSVTVSNCGGSSSSTVSVSVVTDTPIVNFVPAISVQSGAAGSFSVTGADPGGLPLTFTVTQAGAPALPSLAVISSGATSATVNFVAPILPLGQVLPSVVNLTITASNGTTQSAPVFTTVTVNPSPDVILVTAAQYRTSKQRLTINVTDSIVSPNIVLTLQPYLTDQGTIFDPATLGNVFLNQGAGLYLLDVLGMPKPACNLNANYATPCSQAPFIVKSNLNGQSLPSALTSIRQ